MEPCIKYANEVGVDLIPDRLYNLKFSIHLYKIEIQAVLKFNSGLRY